MSTAEPISKDQWPATGVDLETRRRRILATLTALGRTKEVEQFQRALAAATTAAAETQDYAGLEGVVQGWYLHVLALRTVPGWADRWDAVRREPPVLVPGDARSLEEVFADLRATSAGVIEPYRVSTETIRASVASLPDAGRRDLAIA
jgi:hypothetical protein